MVDAPKIQKIFFRPIMGRLKKPWKAHKTWIRVLTGGIGLA